MSTTITHITPVFIPAGTVLAHVHADGSVMVTTHCCSAAVTGGNVTTHNPEGVVCKSCHMPAPAWMGVTYPTMFAAMTAAWDA